MIRKLNITAAKPLSKFAEQVKAKAIELGATPNGGGLTFQLIVRAWVELTQAEKYWNRIEQELANYAREGGYEGRGWAIAALNIINQVWESMGGPKAPVLK